MTGFVRCTSALWGVVCLATIASVSPLAAQEEAARIAPGSGALQGQDLSEFVASWQERRMGESEWRDASRVHETLEVTGGGSHLEFTRFADQGGWGIEVTVVLDRATLAPVSLVRAVSEDLPAPVRDRLTNAGFSQRFEYEFGSEGYRVSHTEFDGTVREESHALEAPVFDGTALGLVLAALPLQAGYEVRLPVLFVQAGDGSATPYDILARVVEEKTLTSPDGRSVPAFQVDVDWLAPETGVVTSPGGPDQPGGAYWIVRQPPQDFPPVPRYKNNSVDYVLLSERGATD